MHGYFIYGIYAWLFHYFIYAESLHAVTPTPPNSPPLLPAALLTPSEVCFLFIVQECVGSLLSVHSAGVCRYLEQRQSGSFFVINVGSVFHYFSCFKGMCI